MQLCSFTGLCAYSSCAVCDCAAVHLCSFRGLSLIVQFKGVEYSSCAVCNMQMCSSRGLTSNCAV